MINYIKKYLIYLVLVLAVIIYISSFFVVKDIVSKNLTDQWADTISANVKGISDDGKSVQALKEEMEDVLSYYYIGNERIQVMAFFRGGALDAIGKPFFSTIDEDEFQIDNYSNGVAGYFSVKDISDFYRLVLSVTDSGSYEFITIKGVKYYIIYTYSSEMHANVLAFVPKYLADINTVPILVCFILVFIVTVSCLIVLTLRQRSKNALLQEELDNTVKIMKDKDIRMDLLSYLMNEFTFEYDIVHDTMSLSEKYQTVFQRGRYFVRFLENLKTRYNIYHVDMPNLEKAFETIMNGKDEGSCLFRLQMPTGNYEWFNSVFKAMLDEENHPIYIVGKIINVHKAQTEKENLLTKSTRDSLTNLLNRSELEKRTANYIGSMDDDDLGAVVIMDLDHFKQVNDTFGHSKGDELLIEVAGLIHDNFRTNDIVGRLGGDEFYIFMKDLVNEADATSRCENLRKILDKNVTYGDTSIKISTSMGLHFVKKGSQFLDIYMKADSALYRAKENGRNQLCIQREGDAINSTKE